MKNPISKSSIFFYTFLVAILFAAPHFSMAQVWKEAFDGLANGTTVDNGSTAWSTTSPSGGASSFSKQTPYTGYELFLVNDTGNEGVWTSQVVNISSYTEIAVEITLYSYFTYSTDYIRCYYKLSGGSEVQFGELLGSDGLSIASAASAIVSGSTLQIVVRGMENTSGSQSGIPRALAFDDVTLSNLKVLYSRQTGDWTDGNTWSTTSLTGSACSCTPDANSRVVIGNSKTVNIPSAVDAAGVTVQNTGVLKYTSNSALTMDRGGSININSGGVVNMNGYASSSIVYGAFSYSVVVDGTLGTGNISAATGSNINFTGAGSVSLGGSFTISSGSGRTITNNVSGGFTIANQLSFTTSSNTAFVNQQPLTVTNQISFASSGVTLTNNSSITAGSIVVAASTNNTNKITNASSSSINVGAITLNNGDFTLDNNGTITQTGNFSTIDAGSSFNNLSGGTWNFSGGGTNTRLFCNNTSSTFNYNAAGAQTIFVPADAYNNLSIAGSGIKTLGGATDVNGNLSIAGTAQLDVSGSNYALSVAGNWNASSTNSDPFVERSGTVTFDGTTTQTISTALAAGQTFNNLVVNKSSNTVQLSSTDATATSVTLTNGGIDLNGRTLTVNSTSTSAISRTNGYVKSEGSSSQLKWVIGIGTGSYVFPFGKTSASSDYIPFTFNITIAGVSATGSVSVLTYGTGTNNTPYPSGVTNVYTTNGNDNSANVVDRFWFITLGNYTTNPTVTVTFVATASEVGTITGMKAQRWNSGTTKWDPPKTGQTNPTAYSTTVPNVNTFSPWTLSGNSTTLPIELLYFHAVLENGNVNLDWKSAQEINNNFYTIEKTTDLENYFEVGDVSGAGTTKEAHTYSMVDSHPFTGTSYYRLKQTDFDGKVSYFKYVDIENVLKAASAISVYPVPVTGNTFTIQLTGMATSEEIPLQIINMQGRNVYETVVQSDDGGQVIQSLSFTTQLPPGVYIIKAGTASLTRKIIVE